MSKKSNKDEEFVRGLVNNNFYTTEKLPDGIMDRVFEEKRRMDAIDAAKVLRHKRVFRWAAVPTALLLLFAAIFPTVMLTRHNDGLIHYADDDLVLEVISENDIKTYYSGNAEFDNFSLKTIDLYKAKDGTPVNLKIRYANEFNELINLIIVLTDKYTYSNIKYDVCETTMQVDGIEVLYNTVEIGEFERSSVAKFTFEGKRFYFEATYYETGENHVESIVSQLVT